ncbi:methyl-accepting chemotaxis protein [Brevibacillus ginsengisoli]|uniref:methyl-accepting chemotaxis protein n=1 Tax=Brevibacillus ginsengisoli TaxID=363854 RepID=UPI003CF900E0
MRTSLARKWILTISILVALPLLLVSIFSFFSTQNILMQEFKESTKEQLRQIDNDITAMFKDAEDDVLYLSTLPNVKKADNTMVTFYDKKEGELIDPKHYEAKGIEKEIFFDFDRFRKAHQALSYIYLGTEFGSMLQSPDEASKGGYDPRKRDWYKSAKANPDQVIRTEPYAYESPNGPIPVISTLKVVRDDQGKMIGVVGADKRLDELSKSITSMKLGKEGYIFLLTKDNTVIAHKDPSLTFKKLDELVKDKKMNMTNLDTLLNAHDEVVQADINGIPSYVYAYQSQATGYKIFAVVPTSEIQDVANNYLVTIGVIGLIVLLLALIIIYFFSRSMIKPILQVSIQAQNISNGDLSNEQVSVKSKDEVGILASSFNQMTASLKAVISSVYDASQQVAASSEELTASAQETSQASQHITEVFQNISLQMDEQVQIAQETMGRSMSAIGELTVMGTNINQVNHSAEATLMTATSGSEAINQAMTQMNDIQQKSLHVSGAVESLNQKSQEIGQIISLITDLSSQTNLLSLNASIEAARAGEHGRGFSVVASEIRTLAEQSAVAAEKIRTIIVEIQSESNKANEVVKESNESVGKGQTLITVADQSFQSIFEAVKQVVSQTSTIERGFKTFSANMQNVADDMKKIEHNSMTTAQNTSQVAATTEQQHASMEEILAASSMLANMAEKLQLEVANFKINK